MKDDLYLLKFEPILKEKIWGGSRLKELFGKKSTSSKTGESWEISDVENNSSIVKNGTLKGKTIQWLLEEYREKFVGKKVFEVFGNKFPLLIKFIDAAETLSVQLHPDDKIAKEKHNSFGKTEMWYIMQAGKDAELILGFGGEMSKSKYKNLVETGELAGALNREKVDQGDAFIIKPGLIHAIGAGVVLAEIQQTSDLTYRIYDWDRDAGNGEKRELHTELAMEAIDLSGKEDFRINYKPIPNAAAEVINTKYFRTNIIQANGNLSRDYTQLDSFVILIGVEGGSVVSYRGKSEELKRGETLLVPASIEKIVIEGDKAKILEVSL
ncbi:mannose-6-phosphate isomerase [Antarcticibacterium arcticum]|uniref:Phosphohexomutase n=1 Tax=Antarcticibacterium arcticum TaxID=2585771 RepID=A0A5B8YKE1_9FLAO|nr:type I phosphomannose isomerase catalytic subunit [Antarcticibacterium arcticum]QED37648.1 mannose-6-phosphate isomerase [Antarcticibacterium arcticum]